MVRTLRAMGEASAPVAGDGSLMLGGADKDPLLVPAAAVMAMVSEGLLQRVGRTVRRTAEGRVFLRRALASAADEPYQAQHRVMDCKTLTAGGGGAIEVRTNAAENPLSWLATRRGRDGAPLIDRAQLEAGQRLARDFERGHRREQITQTWDASGVRGEARRDRLTLHEQAIEARRHVEGALEAVGPGLADVLIWVCCEESGLEAIEKRSGWPARSGKVVLRLALDRLAAHYGIAMAARGAGAKLVHWGAEGYRPSA